MATPRQIIQDHILKDDANALNEYILELTRQRPAHERFEERLDFISKRKKIDIYEMILKQGALECLKHCTKQGLSLNRPLPHLHKTPIVLSISGGHHNCLTFLLEQGADPKWRDIDVLGAGLSDIETVFEQDDNIALGILIAHGVSPNECVKSDRYAQQGQHTLLGDACEEGALRCVKELIKAGAYIDTPSSGYGKPVPPLFLAIQRNRDKVIEELIKAGADPLARVPFSGRDLKVSSIGAAEYAGMYGSDRALQMLIDKVPEFQVAEGLKNTLMWVISSHMNAAEECFNLLLKTSIDLNEKDGIGESSDVALIKLIMRHQVNQAKALIKAGCNVNVSDCEQEKPALWHALEKGQWPLIEDLHQAGASLSAHSHYDQSLLMHVINSCHGDTAIRALDLMSDWNLDLHYKNKDGQTAIDLAHQKGRHDIEALLEAWLLGRSIKVKEKPSSEPLKGNVKARKIL